MNIAIPLVSVLRYFKSRHIGAVTFLLACTQESVRVGILKEMSQHGILSSFSQVTIRKDAVTMSGTVLDLACQTSQYIIQKMSRRRLFSIDREWLFLDSRTESRNISEELGDAYILPNSRVTLFRTEGNGTAEESRIVYLYDLYRVVQWSRLRVRLLTSGGQSSLRIPETRGDRSDFGGLTLNIGTMVTVPKYFYGLNNLIHLGADFYAKSTIHVIANIAEHYNFSTALIIEDTYGYVVDPDGNFNGMVGRLMRDEVDFTTAMMMRVDRFPAIDFTGDVQHMGSPLIFKQPKLSAVTNIYLLPFASDVWWTAGLASLLFGVMLYLSYFFGRKIYQLSDNYDISAPETLTTVLSCICQQGPPGVTKAPGGRITLFLLECIIFFLFVAYSAKIVALLRSSVEKVKTISDLTHGPWEIGIQDILYNQVFFNEITDPEILEFYRKKIEPRGAKAYLDPNVGLEKIRRGGMFAFKVESEWAYRVIEDEFEEKDKCGLSEIEMFLVPRLAIPVGKRSGLREHLTQSVAKQTEVGLLYQANNPGGKRGRITCDPRGIYSSVSLTDFKPALHTMALGVLASGLVLLLEMAYRFKKNSGATGKKKNINI